MTQDADELVVSVVVPAYNAAATIGEQLAALARQRVDGPWEVLVCDNGSTDDTAAIALSWSDRVPVRVIDASARRGPAAARNIGVVEARAPYLAFCDADDVVTDGWLEAVVTALRVDPFIAVGARYRALHSSVSRPEYGIVTVHPSDVLPGLPVVGAGHMALHTAAFREIGGFDETLRTGEDNDLSWRLQLAGYPVTVHAEAIIDIRRRTRLSEVFRQAYHWGVGDRQVRHKFEHVIDALATARGRAAAMAPPQAPASAEVDSGTAAPTTAAQTSRFSAARASTRRVLRSLRSPTEAFQLAARTYSRVSIPLAATLGSVCGEHLGRIDRSAPQLDASVADAYIAAHLG